MTQKTHRQSIRVGDTCADVTPVATWWRWGKFKSEAEARGAFGLASQQALDGMGATEREWMGLTQEEYAAWKGRGELPRLPGHAPVGDCPQPAGNRDPRLHRSVEAAPRGHKPTQYDLLACMGRESSVMVRGTMKPSIVVGSSAHYLADGDWAILLYHRLA